MDRDQLRSILRDVADRTRSIDEALTALRDLPYEDATVAVIDHHRSLRTGVPEVIYGASKTPAQIALIVDRMVARDRPRHRDAGFPRGRGRGAREIP